MDSVGSLTPEIPQQITDLNMKTENGLIGHVTDHLQIAPLVSVIDIEPSRTKSNLSTLATTSKDLITDNERLPVGKRSHEQDNSQKNKTSPKASKDDDGSKYVKSKSQWEPRYMSDMHFNTVKDNHVSHTNNVYIHNFMKIGSIFQKKRKPKEPLIRYHNKRGFYSNFDDVSKDSPMSSPQLSLTSHFGHSREKSEVQPRVEIDEPR